MEDRNGNAKIRGCLQLLKLARPTCCAARRSWRNTFSPSARVISALASIGGSRSGRANQHIRWRKPSSLRFSRKFRREEPQKSSFLRVRIDVDHGDASFGKFEGSTG